MEILATLLPWAGYLAAAILALLVSLLGVRLHAARAEAAHHKESLLQCWHTCLDSLSSILRQLRSLRAILDGLPPQLGQQSLPPGLQRLNENVQSEIEAIEKQLAEMAAAPDQKWLSLSLTWRPGLAEEQDPAVPANPAAEELERLRQDHAALQQKYKDLREQFAGVRKEFDEMLSTKSPKQEKPSP